MSRRQRVFKKVEAFIAMFAMLATLLYQAPMIARAVEDQESIMPVNGQYWVHYEGEDNAEVLYDGIHLDTEAVKNLPNNENLVLKLKRPDGETAAPIVNLWALDTNRQNEEGEPNFITWMSNDHELEMVENEDHTYSVCIPVNKYIYDEAAAVYRIDNENGFLPMYDIEVQWRPGSAINNEFRVFYDNRGNADVSVLGGEEYTQKTSVTHDIGMPYTNGQSYKFLLTPPDNMTAEELAPYADINGNRVMAIKDNGVYIIIYTMPDNGEAVSINIAWSAYDGFYAGDGNFMLEYEVEGMGVVNNNADPQNQMTFGNKTKCIVTSDGSIELGIIPNEGEYFNGIGLEEYEGQYNGEWNPSLPNGVSYDAGNGRLVILSTYFKETNRDFAALRVKFSGGGNQGGPNSGNGGEAAFVFEVSYDDRGNNASVEMSDEGNPITLDRNHRVNYVGGTTYEFTLKPDSQQEGVTPCITIEDYSNDNPVSVPTVAGNTFTITAPADGHWFRVNVFWTYADRDYAEARPSENQYMVEYRANGRGNASDTTSDRVVNGNATKTFISKTDGSVAITVTPDENQEVVEIRVDRRDDTGDKRYQIENGAIGESLPEGLSWTKNDNGTYTLTVSSSLIYAERENFVYIEISFTDNNQGGPSGGGDNDITYSEDTTISSDTIKSQVTVSAGTVTVDNCTLRIDYRIDVSGEAKVIGTSDSSRLQFAGNAFSNGLALFYTDDEAASSGLQLSFINGSSVINFTWNTQKSRWEAEKPAGGNGGSDMPWYTVSYGNSANLQTENGQVYAERVHVGDITYTMYESEYNKSADDLVYSMADTIFYQKTPEDENNPEYQDTLTRFGIGGSDGDIFIRNDVSGVSIDFKFIPDFGYQLTNIHTNENEEETLLNQFVAAEAVSTFQFAVISGQNVHFEVKFSKVENTITGDAGLGTSAKIESANAAASGTLEMEVNKGIANTNAIPTDAQVFAAYDITLKNVVSKGGERGSWDSELTDLGSNSATLTLPVDDTTNYTYTVIREHEGETPVTLEAKVSDGAISFDTNKFSTYTIVRKPIQTSLSTATITLEGIDNAVYTGSPIEPSVTVKLGEVTVPAEEYEISYSNSNKNDPAGNVMVGTVTVTVTAKASSESYTGSNTATFAIVKAAPSVGTVSVDMEHIYTSTSVDTVASYLKKTGTVAGTLSFAEGTSFATAGEKEYTWIFVPTDLDNYNTASGKIMLTVETVVLSSISIETNPNKMTYTYNEVPDLTGIVVKANFADGSSTTVAASELKYDNVGLAVGTTSLEICYTNNGVTKMVTLSGITVNPRNISSAVVTLGTELTYSGTAQTQAVAQVAWNGSILDTSDYTVSGNEETAAGTYTLTITGIGNYNGTVTKQFTITPATPTITLSNLTETTQNPTGVKATLAPADDSAVVVIEYQVGTNSTEATWTTSRPTTPGTYNVRATLPTATANLTAVTTPVTETYTLILYSAPSNNGGSNNSGSNSSGNTSNNNNSTNDSSTSNSSTAAPDKTVASTENKPVETATEAVAQPVANAQEAATVATKPATNSTETTTSTAVNVQEAVAEDANETVEAVVLEEENKTTVVMGNGTEENWEMVTDVLTDALENAIASEAEEEVIVVIDMKEEQIVPSAIFETIKGQDIIVSFEMDNGISWSINGKEVTGDTFEDINFSASAGEGVTSIPTELIAGISDDRFSMELSLAHDGEFGFTAVLTVNVEKENAGKFANLFYFNPSTVGMEFICAAEIREDGNTDLTFTHASDYVIVVDEAPLSVADNTSIEEVQNTTSEVQSTDNAQVATDNNEAKSGNRAGVVIIIIIIAIILGAGAVFFLRKKNK